MWRPIPHFTDQYISFRSAEVQAVVGRLTLQYHGHRRSNRKQQRRRDESIVNTSVSDNHKPSEKTGKDG